jgi:hypothetical protein
MGGEGDGPMRVRKCKPQLGIGRGDYTLEHEMEEDHDTIESLAKKIERWRRAKQRAGASAGRTRRRKAR